MVTKHPTESNPNGFVFFFGFCACGTRELPSRAPSRSKQGGSLFESTDPHCHLEKELLEKFAPVAGGLNDLPDCSFQQEVV